MLQHLNGWKRDKLECKRIMSLEILPAVINLCFGARDYLIIWELRRMITLYQGFCQITVRH